MGRKSTDAVESTLLDEAAKHLAGDDVMAYWRAGGPLGKLQALLGGDWRTYVSKQLSLRGVKACSINRLAKAVTFHKTWDEEEVVKIAKVGLPVREAVRLAFYETVRARAGKEPATGRAKLLQRFREASGLKGEAKTIALKQWRASLGQRKRAVMGAQSNTQRKVLAEARGAVEHRLEAVVKILGATPFPATKELQARVNVHRQVLQRVISDLEETFDAAIESLKNK